jgi:hypothetical protein
MKGTDEDDSNGLERIDVIFRDSPWLAMMMLELPGESDLGRV